MVTTSHFQQNETLIIEWPSHSFYRYIYFSFNIHFARVRNQHELKIVAKTMASIRDKGTATHRISCIGMMMVIRLKTEYIHMQSHTQAIFIQNDIFIHISLSRFKSFYRFSFSTIFIFVSDFSIKVLREKKKRERKKKEWKKQQKKISRAKPRRRRWWRKRFGLPFSSFPPAAHILWQTVSIQLFICVWHSNILKSFFAL